MDQSLAEVAGTNAQTLRRSAGANLEDFAAAARHYGLRWSSGRVSDFESGRVLPTLPTLLAVTAALSAILKRPVALHELFRGGGRVNINGRLSFNLAGVRAALLDGYRVKAVDLPEEHNRLGQFAADLVERQKSWPESVRKVSGGDYKDVYFTLRDSDLRMCKNIGVDRELGIAAMATLWRKTFTARRDELAGPDASPQERGQVSRRLKAELLDIIHRKDK